jgi:arylsulfatase A-like enzyme
VLAQETVDTPRRRTVVAAALPVLVVAILLAGCSGHPAEPTNVVFIVVDTLRADHLGCYGYTRPTTPNLDRLARQATVFERAYSHSPWTMPSVASMFTSLPPRDHGIVSWEQRLPLAHLTLAEHLRTHGFRTAGIVSHVILRPEYNFDQGFEYYEDAVLEEGNPVDISSSAEVSDAAISWLHEEARAPFFLWLHYFDPHARYLQHPFPAYGSRPVDRYDSEIRHVDEQLGRVLDALRALELWDDTVIVFVADHGEEFRDHGGTEHSTTLYDELVRIPLIVHVPGFAPQRVESVVSESDIAPTLCRLLDLPVPTRFGGRSLAFDETSFRVEQDRTVFMETLRKADKRGVRYGRWKLIHDRETGKRMLFDLEEDPSERRNVIEEHPAVAESLERAIAEHYARERTPVEERALPDRLREQLEALGYLQ